MLVLRLIFALLLLCGPVAAQTNPGTSPLSIPKGGTGGATPSAARSALGLAIGTNVEAWGPNLDSLSALTAAADTCFYFNSSGTLTMSTYSCLSFSRGLAANANAGAWRTALGVAIGTNVEAWDNDLDCLAALATTGVIKRTGTGTCSAGTVALSDLVAGTQDTVIGYFGSTAASALAINNCSNALTYSTSTHTFGCNATAGTGNVVNSGTPVSSQVAQWTNATTIQGVNLTAFFINGAGINITGTTSPTVALSLTNTTLNGSPANPSAFGTTPTMMGLGTTCKLTPTYSGRIHLEFVGDITNNTNSNSSSVNVRYGTGAAPSNGAAATGTGLMGNSMAITHSVANAVIPFPASGNITGLTPGTTYWFDIVANASANTSTITNVNCNAFEY